MMTSKIAEQHLSRVACIYIRQSTPGQVRFNQESTERQYNLKNKAQSLGWSPEKIRILDRDLGTPPRMMATKSFLAHKPWGAVLDILTCFMLREPETGSKYEGCHEQEALGAGDLRWYRCGCRGRDRRMDCSGLRYQDHDRGVGRRHRSGRREPDRSPLV